MSRPPRIPNWLPWEQSTVYFITLCVANRKKVLANEHGWQICRSTFDRLNQWTILSALAMPNHLHTLVSPRSDRDTSISAFTKWFKRWFNESYWHCSPPLSGSAPRAWHWQEGCFDRLLRSDESISEKWEYIRQNPVRAGLAPHPDDWPYQFQFNENLQAVSGRRLLV
jgi:putative transposase